YHHQVVMRACIKRWQAGDKEGALREAELWVNLLTEEVETTVEKGWFLPKAVTNAEGALLDLQGRYQINIESLNDLPNSQRYREIRQTLYRVRRVHDWLGYFW